MTPLERLRYHVTGAIERGEAEAIVEIPARPEWVYRGDTNIECGGFWYLDEGDADFVRIVEVVPCSDAGGPDNLFVIETGSLYMPEDETKRASVLDMLGWFDEEGDEAHKRECLIDGFKAYHGIDRDVWGGSITVQIGKAEESDPRGWNPTPDVYLSAKTNLRRYVEEKHLK